MGCLIFLFSLQTIILIPDFEFLSFIFDICLNFSLNDGFFVWTVQEDDVGFSPALAPKQKDTIKKEEPADNSPAKPAPSGSARGTPSASKSAKSKRKSNGDDAKASSGAPLKKVKTENVCIYFL